MPDLFEPIPGHIARSYVLDRQIERLAILGPLHRAVSPLDQPKIVIRSGVCRCNERRPVVRTRVITRGCIAAVLVERVQSHPIGIRQNGTNGALTGFDAGVGKGRCTGKKQCRKSYR